MEEKNFNLDDIELLQKARGGDEVALNELMSRYKPLVTLSLIHI